VVSDLYVSWSKLTEKKRHMTALSQYALLESTGLWRADADAQRREVIVSFGNATIVITDSAERVLSHWSLAAVRKVSQKDGVVTYTPDADGTELVEIDDKIMVEAIEKVRKAIDRTRPYRGRVRATVLLGSFALVGWIGFFWMPPAMVDHTLGVLPEVKRAEIGRELAHEITRLAGPACTGRQGTQALQMVTDRVRGTADSAELLMPVDLPQIHRSGLPHSLWLPGGKLLLSATLVEDYDDPEVLAGFMLAAGLRQAGQDPVRTLLEFLGLRHTITLLTTARLPQDALRRYAQELIQAPLEPIEIAALADQMRLRGLGTTALAAAIDPIGERTKLLLDATQLSDPALLSDSDWLALQGVCDY
jgi:hypothetical protein